MVDKIWYNMEELIGGSEERGINRNILECKDYCFLSTLFRALVLIETYWNVKFSGTAESYIHSCVLIETYWNVKCEYQFQFGGYLGINRNILECKGGWRYLGNDCRKRINRNILECKSRRSGL